MTLPSTGSISLSQVNTELNLTATSRISLNDSGVRSLAGVNSGQISMSNLRGKSLDVPIFQSTMTVGNSGSSYGYSWYAMIGAMSPDKYQGYQIGMMIEGFYQTTQQIQLQLVSAPISVGQQIKGVSINGVRFTISAWTAASGSILATVNAPYGTLKAHSGKQIPIQFHG